MLDAGLSISWPRMMGVSLNQNGNPAFIPTCERHLGGMPAAPPSSNTQPPTPDSLESLRPADSDHKVAVEARDAELRRGSEERGREGRCWCAPRGKLLSKVLILLVVVGAIVAAFPVLKLHKCFPKLLHWIEDNKELGFFIFVGVYAVATVLFIPGAILALGGGFVFGLPVGLLAVWLGGTIGQTFAFLLGRFLLRECITAKAKRFKVWRAIEHVANQQGWKIVALLRLAPVIPYDALNYAFGVTAIRFWQYFVASTVGIIPGTLLFVYFGSLADCIAEIASGDADIDRKAIIITLVASGIAIVVVVTLCTVYAKRALKTMIQDDGLNDNNAESKPCDGMPDDSLNGDRDSARHMPAFAGRIATGGEFVDVELGPLELVDSDKAIKGPGHYSRQDTALMENGEGGP